MVSVMVDEGERCEKTSEGEISALRRRSLCGSGVVKMSET